MQPTDEGPEGEWFDASGEGEGAEQENHPDCTPSGIGIVGADDRRPVGNPLEIPCRWICQLWIRRRDSNGQYTVTGATGVLVSPRHVLTVAHAVKEDIKDARSQWVSYEATDIRVSPARDGNTRALGTYNVTLPAQIAPGWTSRSLKGAEHDYALLTLDSPVGDRVLPALGGKKLCYWGALSCGHRAVARRVPPQSLEGATAFTAGYPKDRGNGISPLITSGRLSGVVSTRRFMNYAADACQGQSGSPVWVNAGGEHRLVGLLVKVVDRGALAIRITREFSRQLRQWMGTESEGFVELPAPQPFAAEPEAGAGEWETEGYGQSEDPEWLDEDEGAGFEDLESGEVLPKQPDVATFRAEVSEDEEFSPVPEGEPSGTPLRIANLAFLANLAGPLDPGIYDGPVRFKPAGTLQACLNAVGKKTPFSSMQFALVDLTKDPTNPDFAGFAHKTSTQVGSMDKLLPMVAAFQLQSDLKRLKASMPGSTGVQVFAEARKRWLATQTPPAGATTTPFLGDIGRRGDLMTFKGKPIALPAATSNLPDLEQIFNLGSGFPFRSLPLGLGSPPGLCDETLALVLNEQLRANGDRDIGFLQRMRAMVGLSDNQAAAACIDDIGFPYIASVMIQAGLWDPAREGGFWLAANYGGKTWRASPLGHGGQTGTAGAFAALLTLMARDALVDASASQAMRAMMNKRGYPGVTTRSGFGSGLRDELKRRSQSPATVFSKLGLLGAKEFDCAIIERDEGGRKLRYVAVGLNAPTTPAMKRLIVELDGCIRANNGLP